MKRIALAAVAAAFATSALAGGQFQAGGAGPMTVENHSNRIFTGHQLQADGDDDMLPLPAGHMIAP